MRRKRIFKNRAERKKYVDKLMTLSSMPVNERQRWEKLIPNMTEVELTKFQNILENEIIELADIYLKILERRSESRVGDIGVEFGEEALDISTQTITQYFEAAPKIDETQFDIVEDESEKIHEGNILRFLVDNAAFIDDKQKEMLLESIKKLPVFVIKDLQEVVIREGLRALKQVRLLKRIRSSRN